MTPVPTATPDVGEYPAIEAVSSEPQADNPAVNLLDGDTDDSSRWSADGFPQWVVIDYDSTRTITGTEVWTYQGRAYQYTVAVSDNPTFGFTTVVDRSGNTSNGPLMSDSFSAVSGRYVKLNVSGASGYSSSTWVSITEFGIVE